MTLVGRLFKRFGYVKKRSDHGQSGYAAALISRLTNDWLTTSRSADEEIRVGLQKLRARSRNLAMNNDYARKYLKMVVSNVVGSNGITFQSRVVGQDGNPDAIANGIIEQAWRQWGKKGVTTTDGQRSWRDEQRLFIETVARDGEVIVRMVRGFENPFSFALQMMEADLLDEEFNRELLNGNRIRMSIEYDVWKRPVAYHLLTVHPGESSYIFAGTMRDRVPANEIIHAYIRERPGQSRGVPWMHSAMTRLNMLGGYEEAELVAARVSAAKMGFFVEKEGAEYAGDAKDGQGNIITESEPGSWEKLPKGVEIQQWDPQHPAGNFMPFMKTTLRGIASGLNVAYNSLASDLEGVNFSSIRSGVLEERDNWKVLQGWMVDNYCVPVFESWLDMFLLQEQTQLSVARFEKLNKPKFQGRGWAWVDPLKDQKANSEAVQNLTKTRGAIVAEQGLDLEEVFEQLAAEKALRKKHGLELIAVSQNGRAHGPEPEEEDEERQWLKNAV